MFRADGREDLGFPSSAQGGGWHLTHPRSLKAVWRDCWARSCYVYKNQNQAVRSVSVTSGAPPPPTPPTHRLMLGGCLEVPHPSKSCSPRGENRTNSLIPPSIRAPALLIGPLEWSESDHVTRQANGMWWEERRVWVS